MNNSIIVEKINNQPFQIEYSDLENKNDDNNILILLDTKQTNAKDLFLTITIIELLRVIIIYSIIVSISLVAFGVLNFLII